MGRNRFCATAAGTGTLHRLEATHRCHCDRPHPVRWIVMVRTTLTADG